LSLSSFIVGSVGSDIVLLNRKKSRATMRIKYSEEATELRADFFVNVTVTTI
jgi:hypothetical protein